MANETHFYVSHDTRRNEETRIRISLWPETDSNCMHVSAGLTPSQAIALAKDLTASVARLPRVASEADLGLRAA